MQEQLQLEQLSTRSRPDVGDVLSFCSAQAGFRARQHLYKVCIVSNQTCCSRLHELFRHRHELLPFQVLQLTTLVIRGPASRGKKFIVSLDRVANEEEEVRGVLLCVQDFVRRPHFTQRRFLSESGLTLLSECVAIADSITLSPVNAPWSVVESAYVSQIINDLCACWDWVVLRRRTAKDTSERWYYSGTPRSATASRPGVIISDNAEEGHVEYVPLVSPALGPPGASKIRSSPSKRKRKISRSPRKLPGSFEISSTPANAQRGSLVEDPSFASALAAQASRGKSRRSGCDRRAARFFQMGFP